jgi:3-oxoadipate enol-lactonase
VTASGADPVLLHHRVEGDGDPVLLLHSVGLDSTFWDEIAAELARSYQVVRMDLRGHGRSPVPPRPWRMDDLAGDVHRTLAELGLPPAHVVGQSFGGLVAQALVLDHPGDVRSVVLSGTSCTTDAAHREVFLERAEAARRGGMEAVAQPAIDRWFTDAFMDHPVVDRARARLLADDPEAWARTFEAIAGHDTLARLGEVGVPCLVVTGDADVATPPFFAKEMASAVPGAELRILPGVPHMGPFECPDLFVPLLGSFFDAVANDRDLRRG